MTKPFEIEVVKDGLDEMDVGRKGRQEEEVWEFGLSFGVSDSVMSQAGGAQGVNQWDIGTSGLCLGLAALRGHAVLRLVMQSIVCHRSQLV